ncbi:uncharacterized protein KY384_002807 [Bacidia gigantensis]|uniref:uncharacterized protein n=1 Tax=Bacidia gigantensis TaxID=2732470 RepID=UPI001D0473D2|nr:uncharacterized protein KY384_002807 [Bacidia gigantensis]KAG8532929.1 hypothetical protein KY384_002807 [Bacidia gigantensis]
MTPMYHFNYESCCEACTIQPTSVHALFFEDGPSDKWCSNYLDTAPTTFHEDGIGFPTASVITRAAPKASDPTITSSYRTASNAAYPATTSGPTLLNREVDNFAIHVSSTSESKKQEGSMSLTISLDLSSIYLAFDVVQARDKCGKTGPKYTSLTVAYDKDELSTVYILSETLPYRFNDVPCPPATVGGHPLSQAVRNVYGGIDISKVYVNVYKPGVVGYEDRLKRLLDPSLANCTFLIISDPPKRLLQANALAPTSGDPYVSDDPNVVDPSSYESTPLVLNPASLEESQDAGRVLRHPKDSLSPPNDEKITQNSKGSNTDPSHDKNSSVRNEAGSPLQGPGTISKGHGEEPNDRRVLTAAQGPVPLQNRPPQDAASRGLTEGNPENPKENEPTDDSESGESPQNGAPLVTDGLVYTPIGVFPTPPENTVNAQNGGKDAAKHDKPRFRDSSIPTDHTNEQNVDITRQQSPAIRPQDPKAQESNDVLDRVRSNEATINNQPSLLPNQPISYPNILPSQASRTLVVGSTTYQYAYPLSLSQTLSVESTAYQGTTPTLLSSAINAFPPLPPSYYSSSLPSLQKTSLAENKENTNAISADRMEQSNGTQAYRHDPQCAVSGSASASILGHESCGGKQLMGRISIWALAGSLSIYLQVFR